MGGLSLIINTLLTIVSGAALLTFVLIISLLFFGAENIIFNIECSNGNLLQPFASLLTGRCGDNSSCPPASLYISCLSLLLIFLLIPMGSLPQFVSTEADLFIVFFLLLSAQGFYIRGIKKFSIELYQSLDRSDVNLLFKFTVALLTIGGAFSWYILNRGIPGGIFSIETYNAAFIWNVSTILGKAGIVLFFVLLSVTSPCRKITNRYRKDNVPLPEIFDAARSTICPAIIAAIFMPWNIGLNIGFIALPMYILDFALFWLKVFILQVIIIPAVRNVYVRLRSKLPPGMKLLIVIVLGMFGSLFLIADLYI